MNPRGNAMVELEHLSKYFGAERAVNDVNLTVAAGEFVTLLGPSGCGKTTTLRCIAGPRAAGRPAHPHRRPTSSRAERGVFVARASATSAWCSSPTRSGRT